MTVVRNASLLALAPLAACWTMPALAQAEFTGAGEHSEMDCDGGSATIEGASNTLVIHGPCTALNVTGAGNIITIDLAEKSLIRIEGASNQIQWSAPGAAKPRISVVGAANRISRRR